MEGLQQILFSNEPWSPGGQLLGSDQHLCFHICKKQVSSLCGSDISCLH